MNFVESVKYLKAYQENFHGRSSSSTFEELVAPDKNLSGTNK
jgi:hypothetical protein